jgi:sterol desaturase/sphingolipid hydroxylase (fatty acid hydroxylase superfamily)
MTVLIVGIVLGMAASGVVMAGLEAAYHAPRFVPHRFAVDRPTKAHVNEKKWLYALNSLLSVLLLIGPAVYAFPWLFTETEMAPWAIVVQALGVLLVYDLLYYVLHRWVFHSIRGMRWIHGLHHKVRTPNARESMFTHPTELAAGLGLLLFSTWLVGPVHVVGFGLAFVVYSVANVVIHSGIAFPSAPLCWLNLPARKHHGHHGVNPNKNFGSITPLWDRLFGTAL